MVLFNMSPQAIAIFIVIIAGLMNGSYAVVTKLLKSWRFENFWLAYGLLTYVFLPWIVISILSNKAIDFLFSLSFNQIKFVIYGGLIWGVGQILFVFAIQYISIGLAFLLNIGTGIILGSTIPIILNPQANLFSHLGFTILTCTIFAIIGLIINYFAAKSRLESNIITQSNSQAKFIFGCTISILCGLTTAGQNITLSLAANLHILAVNSGLSSFAASSIVWPIFFSAAAVPFLIFMFYANIKNKSFANFFNPATFIYYFHILFMSLLWFSSQILYTQSVIIYDTFGIIILWPIFLICIILSSNFWDIIIGEWRYYTTINKLKYSLGMLILIIAIIFLTVIV